MADHLAVFAKYWSRGAAKTRLAATLGPKSAQRLARAMLAATLARLGRVAATRHLVVAPATARRAFERLSQGRFAIALQGEGALGERLRRWCDGRFAAGARRVVVLGADSPSLPLEYVARALDELDRHDAVVGPAHDGGYYLLGLRNRAFAVFEGIDWGTPAVFGQTVDRLRALRASFVVLPAWYDVDTAEDLSRLRRDLAASIETDPAFKRLDRTIERVTGASLKSAQQTAAFVP